MLDLYTHNELDVDYSTYRVINADVEMWRSSIDANISAILKRFSEIIDKSAKVQLFIKRNRLFFTFKGVKYWTIPSCWANEWEHIDQLIAELSNFATDVCYMDGELD